MFFIYVVFVIIVIVNGDRLNFMVINVLIKVGIVNWIVMIMFNNVLKIGW